MEPQVDICLATYNGERYLPEQLDSLFAQTYQGFRIVARDDGSTDATVDILESYACQYPGRLEIIKDDVICGGPARNFMQIMRHTSLPYMMFCDQDDVWHPTKVERMLRRFQQEERHFDGCRPLCLFSDYRVVDADLRPMDVPERNLQVADPRTSLNRLLVQNYVTGCTMMVDRSAGVLSQPFDDRIPMHDWWIALVCAAIGHVVHMPAKLMDYRQHGNNDVGATDVRSWSYRLAKLRDPAARSSADTYFALASLLRERYATMMPEGSLRTLDRFLAIRELPKPRRMARLVAGGYLKSDLVRSLGLLTWI
ncbi:glycosyl transferase [Pseudoscardovia radai]|uniref:Glycosyl transferase n=1 Tax=Pseudoscardovia radai TaxID=987066 RepID=A0A261F2R0_9BIFI|nr:glycosyltransferase family 2 protein [Pseudoscardovia radai]OZG53355.1 glycosyl transferase [Pseudoscardovia radai]